MLKSKHPGTPTLNAITSIDMPQAEPEHHDTKAQDWSMQAKISPFSHASLLPLTATRLTKCPSLTRVPEVPSILLKCIGALSRPLYVMYAGLM